MARYVLEKTLYTDWNMFYRSRKKTQNTNVKENTKHGEDHLEDVFSYFAQHFKGCRLYGY